MYEVQAGNAGQNAQLARGNLSYPHMAVDVSDANKVPASVERILQRSPAGTNVPARQPQAAGEVNHHQASAPAQSRVVR